MTLALYGKSRKRQGSLLLAALLAIIAASVGGLAIIGSAFAHHATITGVATCAENGTYTVVWTVNNSQTDKVMWVDSQSTDVPTSSTTAISPNPVPKTGTRNSFATTTGIPGNSTSITLTASFHWTANADGTGSRYPDTNSLQYVTKTDLNGDCKPASPKLRVVKEVPGNDVQTFSFTVMGSESQILTAGDAAFDLADDGPLGNPKYHDVTLPTVTGASDSYTITEGALPVGWQFDSVSCDGGSPVTGTKAVTVTLTNSSNVTCTFKNSEVPTRALKVCKVIDANGNGQIDSGTFGFTASGGLSTTFNISANEIVGDCKSFTVADGATVTITESSLPSGWNNATGYPKIDADSGMDPADGSSSITVTVTDDSCDGGKDTSNTYGSDCEVTFANKYAPPPPSSVSVDKTHDPAGPFGPGATFKWKLAVTVSGSATTGVTSITDTIPAPFVAEGVAGYTITGPITCNDGDANPATVSCSLATATAPGTYSVEIDITVPAQLTQGQCTTYDNTVTINGTNVPTTSGAQSDKDSVTISCTTTDPAITKVADGSDTDEFIWLITVDNTGSNVDQAVYIEDAGARFYSFIGGGSCQDPDFSDGDGLECVVMANAKLTFRVSKPIPAATCDVQSVYNTAHVWLSAPGNLKAKDLGQFGGEGTKQTVDSNPNESCLTVTKEKSQTSEPPTWTINITSTADSAVAVFVKDDGATYQGATGGSCSATAGVTDMTAGIVCSVNANSMLKITVTKPMPKATCEGTDVSNDAQVWFGRAADTEKPDWSVDGKTFEDLGKDTKLCNRDIRVVKFFQNYDGTPISGYVPTSADYPAFTMTPNPWTNSGTYTIVDDANCDLDTSVAGQIAWTCSIPYSQPNPTVSETPAANWVQSYNGKCQPKLVRDLSEFVGNALNVVSEEYVQTIGWFCNYPVGKITIVKTDMTTEDNTARPADWDFTATGPNSYSNSGSIALGGGSVSFVNVPLGNGYNATEDNGSYDTCRTTGESGIHQYFTTNVEDGPLNITQPGQEITFAFRNEDCGAVLGTGSLHVWKVRDILGDGVMNGADTNIVWTVTIQGPEFPGGQVFNVPVAGLHLNGLTEGVYTITEGSQFSYVQVGVRNESTGNALVNSNATSVNLPDGADWDVTFYNQPLGQIPVHKNAFTSHNGGPNVAAPNDDDGWTITLTSAACGINQQAVTDANGDALFTNLPLCTDYIVKEGASNASSPGFVPLTGDRFENITPNGVTLTFNNILRTRDVPTC
ncbi:MAG: hypothetical protein IT301_14620, partial [Dehalococcoidia bacterium]|nr:hypothetical protein [Dehalococcoidia bacterium]